jgi:hypothetical protein
METKNDPRIRVIHRNLRWEVSIDGLTRPLEDWFFSEDRAVERALETARELDAPFVAVERSDGTVSYWLRADGERFSLPHVA